MGLFPDFVGIGGVVLILFSYYLLQAGRVTPFSLKYLKMNIAGSLLMLYSLCFNWNLSAVIIEIMWLIISLWGLYQSWRRHSLA